MFSRFTNSAFIVTAATIALQAPAMAGTGLSTESRIQMTNLIQKHVGGRVARRDVAPAPYAFKPTRRPHNGKARQARRVNNTRAIEEALLERQIIANSGCAWAKYRQCRQQRALGKNVICYHPGN